MAQSGPDSGGDLFDMAEKGTTVPEDSAKPRLIPSKPRPGEAADMNDPNQMGGADLAGAATNAQDIPRTTQDVATSDVVTGTGDSLPSQVDSKRLHSVPGGVTHDPNAKGSTRYTEHIKQDSEFDTAAGEGPAVEKAPGDEQLGDAEAMDKYEKKES